MCGRYYVDDETAREIERLVRQVDERLNSPGSREMSLRAGDMHPMDLAPVLTASDRELCCRWQRWGFPGPVGKQLIINARSESALEKRMFRESVEHRRIVIPAAGFYEWSKNKEKNTFYRKSRPILFMAGFYNRCGEEDRFVILTTRANASMEPIHDRMPLLLEREEIGPWIFDRDKTEAFLRREPYQLERKTEFEQMSLKF